MYYSSGNYEAFARPKKPADVDKKSAYIVGSGLAALSAACFLVRDGQMKGKNVHILEKDSIPGGACDGYLYDGLGYVMRGGREMDNHFECMWDLFHSIPSIETEGVSVLDEYYWLNKEDPNYSLMRATMNRGEDAHTDKKFAISDKGAMEIMHLFFTPDEELYDKKITDYFSDEVLNSNFWLYWRTMFAFENWHSALEMKLYIKRFIHHIGGLPDFTALRFTKYNQYESMILPMIEYLKKFDVQFHYGTKVENVKFEISDYKKVAKSIIITKDGEESSIDLTENDLVFITNGCCTDTSCYGDQNNAPDLSKIKNGNGESWDLWKNIASQASNGEFGNPDKFCGNVDLTNWMSATIEVSDENIIKHIINICKRDPRKGKVTTGGIVTVKDSTENWYLSWTINRQPQFKSQNKNSVLVWVYALNTTKPGNFIEKAIKTCTGKEICEEWLYHIGIPTNEIEKYADKCNTTTCYMPYINAFFQPREEKDRPLVVPKESINFAFVGQFAETPRDTIFTTEYSIRTGMEAVYTLLKIDRAVPEVWGSKYDVRELLKACYYAVDKKSVDELPLTFAEKQAIKIVEKKIKGTDLEILFKESGLFK